MKNIVQFRLLLCPFFSLFSALRRMWDVWIFLFVCTILQSKALIWIYMKTKNSRDEKRWKLVEKTMKQSHKKSGKRFCWARNPMNPNIPDPKDANDFPTFHVNVSCSFGYLFRSIVCRQKPKMRLEIFQIFKWKCPWIVSTFERRKYFYSTFIVPSMFLSIPHKKFPKLWLLVFHFLLL